MIVAGFGFTSSASSASLHNAYLAAAGDHFVTALATAEDKAAHHALVELAAQLHLPIRPIPQSALAATETLSRSRRSLAERNTGSVAEAAALAAAGPEARLVSPRHISTDRLATCAVAIGGKT